MRKILLISALCALFGGLALYDVSFGWGGWGGGGGGGFPRPPGWGGGGGGRPSGGNTPKPGDPGAGRRPGNPNDPGRDSGKAGGVLKGEKYNTEFDFSHEEKDDVDYHRQGVYAVFQAR